MARINDLRAKEPKQIVEVGDLIQGVSGGFYMVITTGTHYNLLNLETHRVQFGTGVETIEKAVSLISRDRNRTVIEENRIEITIK